MIFIVFITISFANFLLTLFFTRILKLSFVSLILSLPLGYLLDVQYRIFSIGHFLITGLFVVVLSKSIFTSININKKVLYSCVSVLFVFFILILTNSRISVGRISLEFVLLAFFILACTFPKSLSFELPSEKNILVILGLSVVGDLALYIAFHYVDFIPTGIKGEYFRRTGFIRYTDIFHLVNFMLASYLFFKSSKIKILPVVFMLIICLISQERVLTVWTIGCLIILPFRLNFLGRLIYLGVAMGLALVAGKFLDNFHSEEFLQRIGELVSFELLFFALQHRFIDPVMQGGYILSIPNILFGAGGGFNFYIPWFEYRGLAVEANSVDNFYITFLVKYGLIIISLICYTLFLIFRPLGVSGYWIPIYLIVQNGLYVPNFLILILSMNLISSFVLREK